MLKAEVQNAVHKLTAHKSEFDQKLNYIPHSLNNNIVKLYYTKMQVKLNISALQWFKKICASFLLMCLHSKSLFVGLHTIYSPFCAHCAGMLLEFKCMYVRNIFSNQTQCILHVFFVSGKTYERQAVKCSFGVKCSTNRPQPHKLDLPETFDLCY